MIVDLFQSRDFLRKGLFGAYHFFDVKGFRCVPQLACDLITDLNEREPSFFAGLILSRKTEAGCPEIVSMTLGLVRIGTRLEE